MYKQIKVFLLVLLAVSLAALPAYAAISGVFSFGRGSLVLTGVIRGLGNTNKNDVVTLLTGTAIVYAECVNPGGNVAVGRSPIQLSVTIQSAPLQADSNGNASVYIQIPDPATISPAPVSPTPKQAGCPNGNWSVRGLQNGSARWQAARVEVRRNGSTELLQHYNCIDDGVNLSCNPA
jgi:hypothetical protein